MTLEQLHRDHLHVNRIRGNRERPTLKINAQLQSIIDELDLPSDNLIFYGPEIAKLHLRSLEKLKQRRPEGQLILVSAMTPTPAGEGKTTVSIGLAQALKRLGKRAALSLREPSMGPLFGMKGGATGGGKSSLVPAEKINLMFTGDIPAVSAAHNLLAAAIDNHIYHHLSPRIDQVSVAFPRVMDINDRSLRHIVTGLGGKGNGLPEESHFDISAASEVMAILALSSGYADLKQRLGNIHIGLDRDGNSVRASDIGVDGAMAVILADAIHPNLVRTTEGVAAFVHCGPFANIAHGSSSILATRLALYSADYAITEAGFGFDLGAEKFFDITCHHGGFAPELCVLVVTARALKLHGGASAAELQIPNPDALQRGFANMEKHIENIYKFKLPVVVAINRFTGDSDDELGAIAKRCNELQVRYAIANVYHEGGSGSLELAESVIDLLAGGKQQNLTRLYDCNWSPERKIETIAREIYGAEHVDYTPQGRHDLTELYRLGYDRLGACIAKTQKSLSDNPALLGRPSDFVVTVRRIEIAAGAGFFVPITGEILRMPGLPARPAFHSMDINDQGEIIKKQG